VWPAANGVEHRSDLLTRSDKIIYLFILNFFYMIITRHHSVEEGGKSASFSVIYYVVKFKKCKFVLCGGVSEWVETRIGRDMINTDNVYKG
jgi:hypothetical protein